MKQIYTAIKATNEIVMIYVTGEFELDKLRQNLKYRTVKAKALMGGHVEIVALLEETCAPGYKIGVVMLNKEG